ncbi:uncharacterized protein [Antedon mediterranea]|uniref:uncharacterized protein isoform X2 n=1 Tax=Antedon mediterranea TaxID=105859 RepID=UPI003AF78885
MVAVVNSEEGVDRGMRCLFWFISLAIISLSKADSQIVKEVCEADLLMSATGYFEYEWNVQANREVVQDYSVSWNLQLNDKDAKFPQYSVRCTQGCQNCTDEKLRPQQPEDITYMSRTGSDLCFTWKENSSSTNYTMYYGRGNYEMGNFRRYRECKNKRKIGNVTECCPDDLRNTGLVGVRIDYMNEYMKVYGIKYKLRASIVAIPNPPDYFDHKMLNATTVKLRLRDPTDWNSVSLRSDLDKQICQIQPNDPESPCVEFEKKKKWTEYGLKPNTTYIFEARCKNVRAWSEPKRVEFTTEPDENAAESIKPVTSTVAPFNSTTQIFKPTNNSTSLMTDISTPESSTKSIATHTLLASASESVQQKEITTPPGKYVLFIGIGLFISTIGIFAVQFFRVAVKKLFWEIPDPKFPGVPAGYRVPQFKTEPEIFDSLKSRESSRMRYSNEYDSGQGTLSVDRHSLDDVTISVDYFNIKDGSKENTLVVDLSSNVSLHENKTYALIMAQHDERKYDYAN